MSQGKKIVTVLDEASCQRLDNVAVDEARWHELHDGIVTTQAGKALMGNSVWRNAADATEGMAVMVSQLAYTEAETYAREYQDTQFKDLIPVTSEAGPDADTVRYQIYDKVGQGKRINGAAKDIPYSDVAAAQVEIGVVSGGMGYRYSQLELLQAARMIRPLPSERMVAARRWGSPPESSRDAWRARRRGGPGQLQGTADPVGCHDRKRYHERLQRRMGERGYDV
jgi:hypothetical protein